MKNNLKIITLLYVLITYNIKAQATAENHYQGAFSIEAFGTLGAKNYGPGIALGYYIQDNQHVRIGGSYRFFQYREYKEKIIEATIDYGYTFYAATYSRLFNGLTLTGLGGLGLEIVKKDSNMVLIEPYPLYNYVYLGLNTEYALSDSFSINIFARQFYAFNGSKDTLGKWRYDFGLSTKFYFL